jgi:LETM1 and EF-hand domain-containing protein 1
LPIFFRAFLTSDFFRTQTAKLEYAKFLQKTLDEMAPTGKGRDSKSASDFVSFYRKIKTQGVGIVNNEEILKFSKLFEDDITLGET